MCKENCVNTPEMKGVHIKRLNNNGDPDGSGAWCDYSAMGIMYHVHTLRAFTGLSLESVVIGLALMMIGLTLIFKVFMPHWAVFGKTGGTVKYEPVAQYQSYHENV